MNQPEDRSADGDVVARCAAGCGEALEELYARHAAACLVCARAVLRDDHHAEDADRPDAAPTPDVRALERVLAERVQRALAELTPVKREALVLAYWGGCTQREIAERTGVPLGTVKTRMHSALRELGATFRRQADADAPHDEVRPD